MTDARSRPDPPGGPPESRALARVRELFLDDANRSGCAETALVVLKEAFGLPDADDASAATALNGGVGYSGGTCGALTGAAIAVGALAALRFPDRAVAKRRSVLRVARTIREFERAFGATDCRTLIGRDIRTPAQHRAFIDSGVWRTACLARIALVADNLVGLADEAGWEPRREAQAAVRNRARNRRRVARSTPSPAAR